MSFSFNPLGPGGLHHPMHPLLSGGGGFLTAQQLGAPAAANAALLAGINNKPLEFKVKPGPNGGSGSAPMELETVSEHEALKESNAVAASLEKAREESLGKKMLEELHKQQQSQQQQQQQQQHQHHHVATNGGELMFSQLFPHQQPHGIMMMPGVMNMVDGSSLISMQPFPLMAPNASEMSSALGSTAQSGCPPSAATNGTALPGDKATPAKEIIYCKSCTLFPPNPNAPAAKTIDRPPGCRTVFVGGLPAGMTEEVMREIFERCGEITTLRLSKKNFCHIRYVYEASVDSAIYLSGYRVKIGSNFNYGTTPDAPAKEPPIFGVLHVDYAQARDDQYEYECKQRKLQREKRHRERMEEDRFRSLSPQPVVHYTEHEASSVAERLKNDETFTKAVQTLITWLERGDCSKKNSNNFYSMIQSTNSHVRRLLGEKSVCDEELKRAREQYRRQTKTMLTQFSQIEKVFNAASHKKVWDHFTKAQRKNIDAWKKQSLDIKCVQLEDFPDDDGMEMSDDDQSGFSLPYKKSRWEHDHKDHHHAGELERGGVGGGGTEESSSSAHDAGEQLKLKLLHIEVLQETIRNLQTQLLENKAKETERANRIIELEDELKDANVRQLLLKTKIATSKVVAATSFASGKSSSATASAAADSEEGEELQEVPEAAAADADQSPCPVVARTPKATRDVGSGVESTQPDAATEPNEREAKVVAFASAFLMIHPTGAALEQVWAYVGRYVGDMKPNELADTLDRYRQLFGRSDKQEEEDDGNDPSDSSSRLSSPRYRFVGHETSG